MQQVLYGIDLFSLILNTLQNIHYIAVTWKSRRLKSVATRVLVQQLFRANMKTISKVRITDALWRKSISDRSFPPNRPVIRKASPSLNVIMSLETSPASCISMSSFFSFRDGIEQIWEMPLSTFWWTLILSALNTLSCDGNVRQFLPDAYKTIVLQYILLYIDLNFSPTFVMCVAENKNWH